MATTTQFLKLYKPAQNETGWDDEMNVNLDTIDGFLNTFASVPNFLGVWKNATAYVIGNNVQDVNTGQFYRCAVAHTSAVSGLFSADRAAHATFWTQTTNPSADAAAAAAASASAAATSAAAAASALTSFQGTYYGARTTDPVTDPLGAARTDGDLYFNTSTQRLRIFTTTTNSWIEITQTFGDAPTSPPGTSWLRTSEHAWVAGVPQAGGSYTGTVFFANKIGVNTTIPAAATAGQAFSEVFTGRGGLGINLFFSITPPSPPTGGWRYLSAAGVNTGGLVITTTTVGGVHQVIFFTPSTGDSGLADSLAALVAPMIIDSNGALTVTGNAFKPGGGVWAASSDVRIKNIIGPYPHGLYELLEMLPKMFTYKGNDYSVGPTGTPDQKLHPDTTTQYIGLIAQDCEPYMPELVTQTTAFIDGVLQTDVRQVNATGVIYALVNAIATLDARSLAGAPTLGSSLSNDLTMLPQSPVKTSRVYYNSLPAVTQDNSMGATGLDGVSLQGCATSIESHNGVGFQTTVAGQRMPPHMNGVVISPRLGDVYAQGRLQGRSTMLNDAHVLGQLRFVRSSATEYQIMMLSNVGYPTLTSIANGGTGVVVNDRFTDVAGNTYTATAVTAGVATAMTLDSTVLQIGIPANPYALTAVAPSVATGVTVNLARNLITQMSVMSPGDLYLEAPATFNVKLRADPTTALGVVTKQYSDAKNYMMSQTGAAAPTTAQITAGQAAVWKNTTDASVRLYYNDAGSMKSVALT